MLERKHLKLVGSYLEPSFFLTPKMNFERRSFRTSGESSCRDVESSKPGLDV